VLNRNPPWPICFERETIFDLRAEKRSTNIRWLIEVARRSPPAAFRKIGGRGPRSPAARADRMVEPQAQRMQALWPSEEDSARLAAASRRCITQDRVTQMGASAPGIVGAAGVSSLRSRISE